MSVDPLADVLSKIKNYERARKREVVVGPASRMVEAVLRIMREEGFVGELERIEDERGGKFRVELMGKINDCGVVKPRLAVKHAEYERWEKRFLPAAGFGTLIVSTPKGVMPHVKAKEQGSGGRLLAFVY